MVAWEVLLIRAVALMITSGLPQMITGSRLGAGWSGMAEQRRVSSATPHKLILHGPSLGLFSRSWCSFKSESAGGWGLLKISSPHIWFRNWVLLNSQGTPGLEWWQNRARDLSSRFHWYVNFPQEVTRTPIMAVNEFQQLSRVETVF